MLKRLSIRQKQTFIMMATSSVALLLAGVAFITYEVISFREAMTDNLSSLASVMANNSTATLSFQDHPAARELLSSLENEKHIIAACIYDKQGEVFESYLRMESSFAFPPAPKGEQHQFNNRALELFRPVELKGERIGTIYLRSDLEELTTRVRQFTVIVATVMGASIIVALVVSVRLQRFISEPILGLAKVAKVVSAERNYALRASKQADDEVGQLIDGFNEMLAQIQQRDAALQAAHDTLERRVQERTIELEQEIVDRRRAEQGLKQQLTRICLLHSITRAIADQQDLESVVQEVLRQLEEQLPIDLGRVYLFDADSQTITLAGKTHLARATPGKTDFFSMATPLEQTGLGACRTGQTIVLSERPPATAIETKLHEAGMLSAVAIPLMVENELFGILLAARKEADSFGSSETEFLRILGEQVALAAHQARLHAQLRSAYDELRQTQAAVMQQERLRALGQMASGIAHDINNALCPVAVFSDLLLQTPQKFDETTLRNLQNIKTAGEDIAHIVSRMREFYRRRDKTDALGAVHLNKAATQVVDLTRPRWRDIPQARGIVIELETELDAHLPEITGSESELREALTNVILNAVDAMPQGGRLMIRTHAHGRDRATGAPTHAVVELRDTGIGMDEETRRRCLEPFFSTKGKRGTGLGLAMVYGIVERHDGRVEIESALGRGTTVRLIFPARAAAQTDAAAPVRAPVKLPALRVLCVDDEPLLREILRQILENGGHSVELADGGSAGLEMFRSASRRGDPFDVVITDLGMPYLDGRKLSQILKREAPGTPIIMLTGWGTMMKEDGDLPAQVDGVLSKPPKISELYAMLSNVVSARSKAA